MLMAMLVMEASTLFNPLFDTVGVASGSRTVIIQFAAMGITAIVFTLRPMHPKLQKELMTAIVVWLPFVAYAALRTDFNDYYAMIKFWKVIFIPVLSVMTITIMYLLGGEKFSKYFIVTLVAMSFLQLAEAINNPEVFLYAGRVARMTIEGVNPIWLARSFVTAAMLALVLRSIKSKYLRAAVVLTMLGAVFPTGSRGPLIASLIGATIFFWHFYKSKPNFQLKLILASAVIMISVLLSMPYIYGTITNYISRDTNENAFVESGRSALFSRAWSEYMDSPLVGQGMGNFARKGVSTAALGKRRTGNYPHNIILEVMSELGTFGLIFFIIALRPGRHYWRISNIYQILFIVYLVFSMTSGNIVANAGIMVFGVLARLASYYPIKGVQIDQKKYSNLAVRNK